MQIDFYKYQGAGNDFVILDGSDLSVAQLQKVATKLCDRHFGVGADGLIVVFRKSGIDAAMRYFNSDGLETVCGNGIRCVARFIVDQGWVDLAKEKIVIESHIGPVDISLLDGGKRFEVNMGAPIFEGTKIPVSSSGEHLEHSVSVAGQSITVSAVSMGNPHCVIFVDPKELATLWPLAPQLEHHAFFPERANVEFVEIVDRRNVVVKVWERGVGETLACGTGNCAVLAAGVRRGYLEREVHIKAAGGEFDARWEESSNQIFLQGPARFVFAGKIDIEESEVIYV